MLEVNTVDNTDVVPRRENSWRFRQRKINRPTANVNESTLPLRSTAERGRNSIDLTAIRTQKFAMQRDEQKKQNPPFPITSSGDVSVGQTIIQLTTAAVYARLMQMQISAFNKVLL